MSLPDACVDFLESVSFLYNVDVGHVFLWQVMGDTTGLSNAEAKELCIEPSPATKVSDQIPDPP